MGVGRVLLRTSWTIILSVVCRCDHTPLPGPPAGHWPLPLRRRRREMKSNKVSYLLLLIPISLFLVSISASYFPS